MPLVPWLCRKSSLLQSPSVFCLGFPYQCLWAVVPWPLPHTCTTSHPIMPTLPPCHTHYVDHSKHLLDNREKWFVRDCPRPSRCHLFSEPPPARAPFSAYMHSDAHPQSSWGDRPGSLSQECISHSGSTVPHRGPWSVHSSGRRCPHHTGSWPPEMDCWSLGSQEPEPLSVPGCFNIDPSGLRTHGPKSLLNSASIC